MIIKQVTELRKAGELQQAYELAAGELRQHPGDAMAMKTLFWVLRDMAVKAAAGGRNNEATQLTEQMADLLCQFDDSDGVATKALRALRERDAWDIYTQLKDNMEQMSSHDVRQALAHYLRQPVERPSRLHSLFMGRAVQAAKEHEDFNFAEFMNRWGVSSFCEEDWQRHRGEKFTFPSLVERAVTRYVAAARHHRVPWSDGFMALLEQVVERFPDNDQLHRHYGQALHQQGRTHEAMEVYRHLLTRLNTFYAWHELAQLTTDAALRRAALCRAVLAPGTDEFKVKLHLELGVLLADQGFAAEAMALLNAYRTARADRPLHELPGDWFIATGRVPEGTQPVANLRAALQPLAEPADDWLYVDLPLVPALVAAHYTNKQGKHLVRLVACDGRNLVVASHHVPRGVKYVMVRVAEAEDGRQRVVHLAEATAERVMPAFADITVTGPVALRTNARGKRFAFVEGVYVQHDLLNDVSNGQTITVVVETTPDGRRRASVRL